MKFARNRTSLQVSELSELTAANARAFEAEVCAQFPQDMQELHIDLSSAGWLDCGGIGALVSLRNSARRHNRNATVHLANPGVPACRALRLTGAAELFGMSQDGQAS